MNQITPHHSSLLSAGYRRFFPYILTFLAVLVLGTPFALAQQSSGDILGIVTDQSGAAIPGATVTSVNIATKDTKVVQSDSGGSFAFSNLMPGTYTVTIEAKGFSKTETTGVVLQAGDRHRLDTKLNVGAVTETVEVATIPAALQTDTSVMNSSLSTEAVANLPLNGRNYTQLVQIVPGATEGNPGSLSSGTAPDDRRQGSNVSINSQSDVLNDNMIDGLDNNERIIGTVGVRPSVDSIQEVKILTNNYTADSGRAAGAIVNIITKSGTNTVHGSLYEYFRNDKLNAFSYQFGAHNPKPELRQNQFGGSLGFPVLKNRTFVFGDVEFFRLIKGLAPASATVPTAFEQNNPGNFSDIAATQVSGTNAANPNGSTAFCNPGNVAEIDPASYKSGCAYQNPFSASVRANPALNGYQYPGNIIPAGDIDPVGLDYFSLYSLPNVGTTSLVNSFNARQFFTVYDIRVDHKISNKDSIFGRYSQNSYFTFTPAAALPIKKVAGLSIDSQQGVNGSSPQTARNAQVNYSHTFTPQLLANFGAGYTLVDNYSTPPNFGLNPNTAFGEPGINFNQNTSALGGVSVTGLTGFGAGRPGFVPLHDKDNTYQISGAVFYTHGKQSLKMGSALIRRQALNFQESNGMGNITFQNGAPGLLTGMFSAAVRNNNYFTNYYRTWEPSVFFQDDWRVNAKLTLNLGMRWDLFTPFVDKYNHISNFLPINGGELVVANQSGISRAANVHYSETDFQPRAGFAYSVTPKTVVRGGFGLSFFPTNQASPASLKDQPWIATFGTCDAITCPAPYNRLQDGLPVPGTVAQSNLQLNCVTSTTQVCYPQALNSSEPNYTDGFLEQYNLTVQQEIAKNTITISYVGSSGHHLGDAIANENLAPLGYTSTATANVHRAFYVNNPNLTNVPALLSDGTSNYNGLQASIERRFINGLGYNVSTTISHDLDNVVQIGGGGTSTILSLDPTSPYYHPKYDRGNGDLDQRARFVFQGTYAPKFFKNAKGIEGALLSGWQGNVIAVDTTGLPFNPANGSNISFTTPGGGGDRPNVVSNPKANVAPSTVAGQVAFFNPAAYVTQAAGTAGNSPRNPLHAAGIQHVDGSLGKIFPIHDRLNLNFKAEAFNILNSVVFSAPSAGITSSTFGKITATRADYNPRLVQFALRLEF